MTARDSARIYPKPLLETGRNLFDMEFHLFTVLWEFNSPFQSLTLWLYGLISLFIDGTVL